MLYKAFDLVSKAVSKLCNSEGAVIPSLALKLGFSIQKCCFILSYEAIKTDDGASERRSSQFLQLYDAEWS